MNTTDATTTACAYYVGVIISFVEINLLLLVKRLFRLSDFCLDGFNFGDELLELHFIFCWLEKLVSCVRDKINRFIRA